jgi:hypothetical protein
MVRNRPHLRTRVPALAVVLVVVASVVPHALAGPAERLDRAEVDLAALTVRLQAAVTAVATHRAAAADADRRMTDASARLAMLLATRARLDARIARVEERLTGARAQLDRLAAEAFMGATATPASALSAFFGSATLGEFSDRVVYAEVAGEGAADVATEVAVLRADLGTRAALVADLVATQTSLIGQVDAARREHATARSAAEAAVAELDAARDEIVALIARLRERRAPGDVDLSGVRSALHGEDHVTYGRWASLFLRAIDAPVCRDNMVAMVAWQVAESTQAAWNPLATTRRMPGSTDFNSVGVQNFQSLAQGLEATWGTIENGWEVYRYGAIVRSLRACGTALQTALSINASSWCPGCVDGQYVLNVVPRVDADLEAYLQL